MANLFDKFDTPQEETPSNFFDKFDETKTISTPQTQTATTEQNFFDKFDETQPGETPEKMDEDELDTNQQWLKNAAIIYNSEEGENWKGSQKDLSDWMKDRHSKRNFDITNMGITAYRSSDLTDKQERAWLESELQYTNTKGSWSQVGRGFYHTITDPFTFASILTGVGAPVLFGGKVAAGAGLNFLGKTLFKNNLKDALIKRKVSEKLASQIVKKGAVKGVKKEVLEEARKEAANTTAKYAGTYGAAEGALYMTAADIADQSIDLGLDVDRDRFIEFVNEGDDYELAMEKAKKTDFDYINMATMAGAGLFLGGAFVGVIPKIGEKIGRKAALRRVEPDEVIEKVSETSVVIGGKDTKNDIVTQARRVQEEVEVDGTVNIDLSVSRKDLADQFREMKKTDEWKKMSPKQKREWRVKNLEGLKEKEKTLKEVFNRVGVELEPVKGQKGKYTGTKVIDEVVEETTEIGDRRSFTQKLLGTLKGEFFDSPDDFLGRLRTRKDSAVRVIENNISTRLKNYTKAIKDNYGYSFKAVPKHLNRVLDDAFRGDEVALATVTREAPEVAEQLQALRQEITNLQDDLLKSGAIEEGSQLETKIVASQTPTGKPTLYVTRKYQMHDNPKWTKFLRKTDEGQDIVRAVKKFILLQSSTRDKKLGKVLDKSKSLWTREDQEIYDSYMKTDGYADNVISDILNMDDESKLISVFEKDRQGYQSLYDNASNILKRRKNIPEEIRALMGEYDNPISNYANTAMKLFQTIEDFKYEKQIADAIMEGDRIAGTAVQKLPSEGVTTKLSSYLPSTQGVTQPFEEIEGMVQPFKAGKYDNMYGTKEVAAFIANGNEISRTTMKPLQAYLMLQGHSRAMKTIWSITGTARNFLSAGWMALGAGYMNPKYLKEVPKIFRGMYLKSNEALNIDRERGLYLGFLQSGTDIGSFRGAMKDAGQETFWDLTSPLYKGEKSLIDRAKKANTSAAKFYQSMDDMWKQFGFMNEKGNYRQILIDQGIDPDEITRTLRSADGIEFNITKLDEVAAEAVNKHMQNYAGVPKFIKRMRLAPFADFIAFKSEILRTQKNIIKSAFKDIGEGSTMIRRGERNADGSLKGVAQRNLGVKRLGSFLAAQSAAPAMAYTTAQVWEMNEVEKGNTNTIKDGIEAFERDYNKGAAFWYMGKPDKGKGRRINISYINPWSPTQDPIMAAFRAFNRGEQVDGAVDEAFYRSVIEPMQDAFSPSMVAKAVAQFVTNVDDYGRPIFSSNQAAGQDIANGTKVFLQAFEPGGSKSIRDIYQSYNLSDLGKEFGVYGKAGKRYQEDAWISLSGVKPERYDIGQSLAFKLSGLKKDMGETNKIFKNAYQQRDPITVDELVDSYSQAMEKQFSLATEMFDYISKAKSVGLNDQQIIKAITDNGLFMNRLDKKFLINLAKTGKFIPPPPLQGDVYKWGISTKRITGQRPPVKEAQRELMNIYRSYAGRITGLR